MRFLVIVGGLLAACGGGDDGAPPGGPPIAFPADFRFGAASAATQIEEGNTATDWYLWTAPEAQGGFAKGTFVGDAARGYAMVMTDLGLVHDLGLDSYRFSMEWARIEPRRDVIDEAALAHYRTQLEAMHALGIRPVVTVHHFSNPVWVADPRGLACQGGPSDTNLCGFGSAGGPQIVAELGEHAALLARRFGDLVDDWGTVNEPINYLLASYALGQFPPGGVSLDPAHFAAVLRDYLAAHAAIYDAIKANDLVDADGDGVAASVGMSLSVGDWQPARGNAPSTDPDDLAARDRLVNLYHWLWVDSIAHGSYDADLDGVADEAHPEWQGKLDWLGLQYYFRAGVTAQSPLLPAPLAFTPCFGGVDFGACLPAPQPSYCARQMGYEAWADGLYGVLTAFAARYPALPLYVTESGLATDSGVRRAEHLVRILEAVARARADGADVRGYFEWSLTDNFEWAEGFKPHFGLYTVDPATYARTANEGADVLRDIATAHEITSAQRGRYGGTGPMTLEPGEQQDSFCRKE